MQKNSFRVIAVISLLLVIVVTNINLRNSFSVHDTLSNFTLQKAERQSKAKIVSDIKKIITEIQDQENKKEKEPIQIFSADETKRLWSLSLAAYQRLYYLNYGRLPGSGDFPEEHQVDKIYQKDVVTYTPRQVTEAIGNLKGKIPDEFLDGYRVYISPNTQPGISGMGGPGFSVIYSLPSQFEADLKTLEVTLYHEIGHHIHLSYMEESTATGSRLWSKYHQIRGGEWHKAGEANTEAWNHSSEETFAEDFRMLFGKDQPFFNDMVLGDPRVNPEEAQNLKKFIIDLAQREKEQSYRSPWIPNKGLNFWLNQNSILGLAWIVFLGIIIQMNTQKFNFQNKLIKITL